MILTANLTVPLPLFSVQRPEMLDHYFEVCDLAGLDGLLLVGGRSSVFAGNFVGSGFL